MIERIVAIGIDFLTILGPFWPPTWGAPGGPTNQVFVHLEIDPSAPYSIIYNTKWPSGNIAI